MPAPARAQTGERADGMRFLPDVPAQLTALTERAGLLGLHIGNSPTPSSCKHYQGIVPGLQESALASVTTDTLIRRAVWPNTSLRSPVSARVRVTLTIPPRRGAAPEESLDWLRKDIASLIGGESSGTSKTIRRMNIGEDLQ